MEFAASLPEPCRKLEKTSADALAFSLVIKAWKQGKVVPAIEQDTGLNVVWKDPAVVGKPELRVAPVT